MNVEVFTAAGRNDTVRTGEMTNSKRNTGFLLKQ
jgi:hypothetical protein